MPNTFIDSDMFVPAVVRITAHISGTTSGGSSVAGSTGVGARVPIRLTAFGSYIAPTVVRSGTISSRIAISTLLAVGDALPDTRPRRVRYDVVNAQTYRTKDFWEKADWYHDDYDPFYPPVVTYETIAERNRHENPQPKNTFVKIKDDGRGYWIWTAYVDDAWRIVAQEQGTYQFSDKLASSTELYGIDDQGKHHFDPSKIVTRDGSLDLKVLTDAILDNPVLTDLEKNELWFSMINYVHANHDQVDWAFKTSFMSLLGYNEQMLASPVAKPDNTDFILSYVDEVKPFHVTLREFSRSYARREDANVRVTDFDKAGYLDPNTGEYRRLDETNPDDVEIMKNGAWNEWLTNMDLARKINATIKFDRVWPTNGVTPQSAADRIMAFYQPDAHMAPKDLRKLLELDFKGTVLDGMTINDDGTAIEGGSGATIGHNEVNGFTLRDPRMAEDTPEEMVRLGSHDTINIGVKDRWGAGAPRHIVKTYDVSKITDTTASFQVGMIARNVIVFADGARLVENTHYGVDYLANNVFVPLLRGDGTRVNTITVHAIGFGAHNTVIDQTYHYANSDGMVEKLHPKDVLDWIATAPSDEEPVVADEPAHFTWGYEDVWKYANATVNTDDFSSPLYDDSIWNSGKGGFGSRYDGGNHPVGTLIPSTHRGQTIWLRKKFNIIDPDVVGDLHVEILKDDFAKVYWNGVEVPTFNVSTYRAEAIIPKEMLTTGENLMAVRVENGVPANIFAAVKVTAPNFGTNPVLDTTYRDGDYYAEVTENGDYISSSYTENGVLFKAQEGKNYAITYYKGKVRATTSLKEARLPLAENPNDGQLVISDSGMNLSGDYQKNNFVVDFAHNRTFTPSDILSGVSRLYIRNLETNASVYDSSPNFKMVDAIQGAGRIVTQHAANIGAAGNTNPRYRALHIRPIVGMTADVVIGTNGIYSGAAVLAGTSATDATIPETANVAALRNAITSTVSILVHHNNTVMAFNDQGDLTFNKTIHGWTPNTFFVRLQQSTDKMTVLMISPDAAELDKHMKLITVERFGDVTISDFVPNGYFAHLGNGFRVQAAAFNVVDNCVVLWGKDETNAEAVVSYSFTQGGIMWETWSNRLIDGVRAPTIFHSPRGMHLSRISRGSHIVWQSSLGTHHIHPLTGEHSMLNSTPFRNGDRQFWDEETGKLVSSRLVGGTETLWRHSITFPDTPFSATYRLSDYLLDDLPHTKPYHSSIIVEVNGLRLAPPLTFFAQRDKVVHLGTTPYDPAKIRVHDDTGDNLPVTRVPDDAYETLDSLIQNATARYVYWRDQIVFRDSDAEARYYTVSVEGTGDYSINDNTTDLTIHHMVGGDNVRVAFWRNDSIMRPTTWSFRASPDGKYRIKTSNLGSSWLTINGRRLVENVDYSIRPITLGAWDTDGMDTFRWENLTEVDIVIKNMLSGHETDQIVLTTFEGPWNTPKRDWHHASIAPSILLYNEHVDPAFDARPLVEEPSSWSTEIADLRFEGGTLIAPLPLTANGAINVKFNALDVPEEMFAADPVRIPDAGANRPEVVWVGPERIEYFKRTVGNGSVVLDQIRRGTKGTPKLEHPAGTPVRVTHPMPAIPAAPRTDILPTPLASSPDAPNDDAAPEFEGWFLKVRFKTDRRGRDWNFYGYNYRFGDQIANPPSGRQFSNVWNGGSIYELGTPLGATCSTLNQCGQPLVTMDESEPVEPMEDIISDIGGAYQTAPAGTRYNPYDWTHTHWYDIAPGPQSLFLQYGAFNFTGTLNGTSYGGMGAAVGFQIEYKWWNSPRWVRAYTGLAYSLWPETYNFNILPPDEQTFYDEVVDRRDMVIPVIRSR